MTSCDLRLGTWQSQLADVECDVLCTDPPFSDRVHSGQRTGSSTRKSTLVYESVDEEWVRAFVEHWAARTRWWAIIWSDHLAQRWYEAALQDAGWYVFAPVIWERACPTPRMSGDGPTSAADYMTIARPRRRLPKARMGSRPGKYVARHMNGGQYAATRWHPGGKCLQATRHVIRDYALPTDLVADPCSGGGTTARACQLEGRSFIGSEMDPATHAKAIERLAQPFTAALFNDTPDATQEPLL